MWGKPPTLPAPKQPSLIYLQESVDNAILEHLHKKSGGLTANGPLDSSPHVETTFSDYPETLDRLFRNFSLVRGFGCCYFAMGPIITLITLLQAIVREKEFRLRSGLNVVGVSHNVYWCNWIIVGVLISVLQVLV